MDVELGYGELVLNKSNKVKHDNTCMCITPHDKSTQRNEEITDSIIIVAKCHLRADQREKRGRERGENKICFLCAT